MKRIRVLAASAALLVSTIVPAQPAPKSSPPAPAVEARASLQQIDDWAAVIADTSFRLHDMAQRQFDPRSHLDGLSVMKDDINRVGKEVKALEAQRESLAAWEVQALDQIEPLMQDAAGNAEKAIETYNSDRRQLWASAYVDDTAKVEQDTGRVATLLHDYLKLEKTQKKEQKIERDLGEANPM